MKTLSLIEMENVQGGASWDCWAMFAGVVVGAAGGLLNPLLGASMIALGVSYIDDHC